MTQLAICGQGRIGARVTQALRAKGHQVDVLRLDKEKGLYSQNATVPTKIQVLLICISSAKAKGLWDWTNIFDGLEQQVNLGQLKINNLIFVSSTRVFDGIGSGLVTSQTEPQSNSERGQKVIQGEDALKKVCSNLHLVRCSGLIGGGYDSYRPILSVAKDRPRFAVEVEHVKQFIISQIESMLTQTLPQSISLLTDGKVYFEQRCYDVVKDKEEVIELSKHFRILVNGSHS